MQKTREKFADKLIEHIKEKYNSYMRIENSEGTCAAFVKKETLNQMWGISPNKNTENIQDHNITYPVTYTTYDIYFVIGPDSWREPSEFIKHNSTSGPLGSLAKLWHLWEKFYVTGITADEIIKELYKSNNNYWHTDPNGNSIHVIDEYFSTGDWKVREFPIEKGNEMIKDLKSFVPYGWKESGPFMNANRYTYYINMDKSKIDKKDNPKTCFDLEYKYIGPKFNASKMSIEQFKEKLLITLQSLDSTMFDSLEIDKQKMSLVELASSKIKYVPWYTLCNIAGVDHSQYEFSFENAEAEKLGITDNGVPYLYGWAGGDWENPVGIILYWSENKLNYYIPLWGNTIRRDTLKALGNDYESDTDYIINDLAPWMKNVYTPEELDELVCNTPIYPNREAIIDSFSKAVNPV